MIMALGINADYTTHWIDPWKISACDTMSGCIEKEELAKSGPPHNSHSGSPIGGIGKHVYV